MLGYTTRRWARRRVALARFPRRRRVLTVLFLLVALAVSGWGGLWGYRKFKARQSVTLTEMAAAYLEEKKPAEARMALDTALRLQPGNIAALRMLAQIQTLTGETGGALQTWGRVAASGGLTLADLSIYAQTAATAGDWALAERLADAAARGGNTALRHMLRAELKGRKNDLAAMEAELRAAVEVDETGNAKAMLARFLLQRPMDAASAVELRGMLRELSARQDGIGAEALASGLTRGLVPREEVEEWIEALRAHPAVNTNFLLLADAVEVQLEPASKDAVVAKVVERMRDTSLEERLAGMQWLVRFGEPAKAAALVTRDEALQQQEGFMAWLDALSMSQDWSTVLDGLSQPSVPFPEHFLTLYRGRTLKAMGRGDEGDREFLDAYNKTAQNPAAFRDVLGYLALAGEDELFYRGLEQALGDDATAPETFRRLVPSLTSRRDSGRLLRAYEIARETSPALASDLILQNDMDYLSLLLGRPVDSAAVALRSEGNPRDFALRATQGLSLLLAGNPREALAYLDACEPDVHVGSLAPHQQVVVAAALAANGREREAYGVMALVSPLSVSQQEVDLLRRYLPLDSQQPSPGNNRKK